jgi:hypothetical protein
MFDFLDSMCGCFSPAVKRSIIDYLSSSKLNHQLMEEEKVNEDSEPPAESIYDKVKTKSYYFMKLQEDEQKEEEQSGAAEDDPPTNVQEPNYYPSEDSQDYS